MSFVKFLGTAGARFVVMKQLRSSAGVWLSLCGKNIILDPGPGTLVRCHSSKPKLDPERLDAVILTHNHIDHSNDVNIMLEAMSQGGHSRRGTLFAPRQALEDDPVVRQYVREYIADIQVLTEGGQYELGDVRFATPVRHVHAAETYGLRFELPGLTLSFIVDTLYFPELPQHYAADVMVLHVVREPWSPDRGIQHLSVEDAKLIVAEAKPRVAIITHFGMTMLRAKPWVVAQRMTDELGIRVLAASDGMSFDLDTLE
jgi:phosphoribosyl 1,2-cyclic phosphodiesterase